MGRYNRKTRAGKGFTLEELAAAGVSLDHRRSNRSIESKQANVNRLKAYKEKLVLLPKVAGKPKKGGKGALADATEEQVENVAQTNMRVVMPVTQDRKREKGVAITKDMKDFKPHRQIRQEWSN